MPGSCPVQHKIVSALGAWFAFVAACTSALTVRADAASARFVWSIAPPPSCVNQATLADTVEARLGRRVFNAAAANLTIDARYAPEVGLERVRLEVRSAPGELLGEREVSAASCELLAAALPVVIAVLLDLPPEVERAAVLTAAGPVHPSSLAWRLSASLQTEIGVQPGIAPGMEIEARVGHLGPFSAGMFVNARLPTSTVGEPALVLQRSAAGATLCVSVPTLATLTFSACARAGVSWLRASGEGVQRVTPDARFAPEVAGIAQLDYPLSFAWVAQLQLGVVLPISAPEYGFFDNSGLARVLFRPGLGGVLGVGISWLMP